MNFRKNSKGITLIALVITIIVLLILAGVSLNLVAGGDGIISKAIGAVEKHKLAELKEELELAMAELNVQYYQEKYIDGTANDESFEDWIKRKIEESRNWIFGDKQWRID